MGAMDNASNSADEPAWTDEDHTALATAYRALEHPSFAARVTELLGVPLEYGLKKLPAGWQSKVQKASQSALEYALDVALKTMDGQPSRHPDLARKLHRVAVAVTGTAGGVLGPVTLALELPITTGIMLRAIADIARAEGEDLRSSEARLACIEVFALGGPRRSDDATEAGYFAVRIALAQQVAKAAEYVAHRGVAEHGAPAVLRLITRVAQRFSVQVSEKVAAEAVPIVGAVGGATINVIFIDHFQSMARGHFTVRRLERRYGQASVRARYEALRVSGAEPSRNSKRTGRRSGSS
jgi:hypothetical protein